MSNSVTDGALTGVSYSVHVFIGLHWHAQVYGIYDLLLSSVTIRLAKLYTHSSFIPWHVSAGA